MPGAVPVRASSRAHFSIADLRLGDLMRASAIGFILAILVAASGMIWGITMGITGNHTTFSAHAHLNLLGWVSLFLMSIFYHLHPAVDRSRGAVAQVVVWVVATVIMAVGIGVKEGVSPALGEPIAAIGSLAVFADFLFFAWLAVRRGVLASA